MRNWHVAYSENERSVGSCALSVCCRRPIYKLHGLLLEYLYSSAFTRDPETWPESRNEPMVFSPIRIFLASLVTVPPRCSHLQRATRNRTVLMNCKCIILYQELADLTQSRGGAPVAFLPRSISADTDYGDTRCRRLEAICFMCG